MDHTRCYRAIEEELDRRGIDYTIHGLPGTDDIVHFEEYWLTNLPGSTKLFPAIMNAEMIGELEEMVVRAVTAHAADGDTAVYRVVLCGDGWSPEGITGLQERISARTPAALEVSVEPLAEFVTAKPTSA